MSHAKETTEKKENRKKRAKKLGQEIKHVGLRIRKLTTRTSDTHGKPSKGQAYKRKDNPTPKIRKARTARATNFITGE